VPFWHLGKVKKLWRERLVREPKVRRAGIGIITYYFSDFLWRTVDLDLSVDEWHD